MYMLVETKILISYIVLCLFYTLCRMHYLMCVKKDSELNKELGKLIDYAGDEGIVKVFVIIQILCCPIIAPMSIINNTFKFITKKSN